MKMLSFWNAVTLLVALQIIGFFVGFTREPIACRISTHMWFFEPWTSLLGLGITIYTVLAAWATMSVMYATDDQSGVLIGTCLLITLCFVDSIGEKTYARFTRIS